MSALMTRLKKLEAAASTGEEVSVIQREPGETWDQTYERVGPDALNAKLVVQLETFADQHPLPL
ncbi:MAG: hypothetical protein HQL50_05000 [Magnetococcales bacterium]|nr:hypothetical protein [Magnetococcales bacterium]